MRWSVCRILLLIGCSMMVSCHTTTPQSSAPTATPENAKTAVRAVLAAQVAAWNSGDLSGFMAGYAPSDTLRFASGGNERLGWQTTLDAYRRGYPNRTAMGTLAFDVRDVQLLSPDWALVFGAWRLERKDDRPHGLFTLLFRRTEAGWLIVHDHTSSGS